MSLRVVAVITASPGSEQAVGDALATLAAGTRDEPGCESYELFRSHADAAAFVTVEQWTEQSALDAHMQGANIKTALATVGDLLAEQPRIHPLEPLA